MTTRSFSPALSGLRGLLLALLLLAGSMLPVSSEIIDFDMIIEAASDEIHYVRGYLQAPASISLSNVRLYTMEMTYTELGDDLFYDSEDDEYYQLSDFEKDEYSTSSPKEDISVVEPPMIGGQPTSPPATPYDGIIAEEEFREPPETRLPIEGKNDDEGSEGGSEGEVVDAPEMPSDKIEENVPENPPAHPAEDNKNGGDSVAEEEKNEDPAVEPPQETAPAEEEKSEEPVEDAPAPAEEGKNVEPVEEAPAPAEEEKNEEPAEEPPAPAEGEKSEEPVEEAPVPTEEGKNEEPVEDAPAPAEEEKNEEPVEEAPAPAEEEKNEEPVEEPPAPAEEEKNEEPVEEAPAPAEEEKNEEPVEEAPVPAEEEKNEEPAEEPPAPVEEEKNEEPTEETAQPPAEEKNDDGNDTAPAPGGDRSLEKKAKATGNQMMDIVLFELPAKCKRDQRGNCELVTLGVGGNDREMEDGLSYCCSEDAADRGICDADAIGRMIINHNLFKGEHRKVEIPVNNATDTEFKMEDPNFNIKESGEYMMVIANCKDGGLGVITLGTMEWKSVTGYLPGDIYGLMLFYAAMAGVYLVLVLWYYCGMRMFQDAAIPIQKYILATIILGFLETSFRGVDFIVWNSQGVKSEVLSYIAISLGILKQGSSRCLGVMVAMGWGVVRDTLGMALFRIVVLGLLYSGLYFAREFLELAASSIKSVSVTEKEELIDLVGILKPIIFIINIIFAWWIISALRATADYLRNMNQSSKLRRHLRLRCLFMTSFIIMAVLLILSAAQHFTVVLSPDLVWIFEAVGHGTYLLVLFGVAVLWRPNRDAQNYVMQMELPAAGDGDSDLELSCVVPSADDMDFDGNYKIDDAIAS